jgi:hypothetical protein
MFDPALIEQEIKRNLFEPSSLLQAIGYLLKEHCAPMRDSAVDEMIQAASACAVDGKMAISDALGSFRMCMELFEIMKLVSVLSFQARSSPNTIDSGYSKSPITKPATLLGSHVWSI